ncbi:MAG: S1 family peptidase [Halobacteriales archaeon]|nr:S1 family peptidase [Halobacteriales archaeon]
MPRAPFLAALALLLALPLVPAHAVQPEANSFLQPGTEVDTPAGQCSLNFVWVGGGATYICTAGHCISVGQRASTPGIGAWGTGVMDLSTPDFALIKVDAAKVGLVRYDVQHWGGPTGVATPSNTGAGALLAEYGYGIVFSLAEPTRAKQGVLLSLDDDSFVADTEAVNGDSGGPFIAKDTGRAVGVVSEFNLPLSTDIGPTVASINAALAAHGYAVTLQTAPRSGALV